VAVEGAIIPRPNFVVLKSDDSALSTEFEGTDDFVYMENHEE